MSKYTTAVIGLGQIGQEYDFYNSDSSIILSHASAIKYHDNFELVSAVDPDISKCNRFEEKFKKNAFLSSQILFSYHKPEVIVIAAPTDNHLPLLIEAIEQKPKAIILEKPISNSEKESNEILEISNNTDCKICVNYIRRFNPAIQELKRIIDNGELGQIYKGVIWYTKGIVNNGSHFIDLLIWFFGEIKDIVVIRNGRKWANKDPEPDLCISFKNTEIYMLSGMEENFYMGTMKLVGTNGEINYVDGKDIQIQFSEQDPMYLNYKGLTDIKYISNPSEVNIWYLYENLSLHLNSNKSLLSDIDSAGITFKNVMKILKKIEGFDE